VALEACVLQGSYGLYSFAEKPCFRVGRGFIPGNKRHGIMLGFIIKPNIFSIVYGTTESRALVRLKVYLVGVVEVLFRHALSGL
jgi:hypothetical protein